MDARRARRGASRRSGRTRRAWRRRSRIWRARRRATPTGARLSRRDQARGARPSLLDLPAGAGRARSRDDDDRVDDRIEATLEALRIDTDRMPTVTDEELAAEAAREATRGAEAGARVGRASTRGGCRRLRRGADVRRRGLGGADAPRGHRRAVSAAGAAVEPPPFPLLSELPRGAFMELLARLSVVRLAGRRDGAARGRSGRRLLSHRRRARCG